MTHKSDAFYDLYKDDFAWVITTHIFVKKIINKREYNRYARIMRRRNLIKFIILFVVFYYVGRR